MGVGVGGREGEEGIIPYKRTSRSPNIEVLKIVCNPNVPMFDLFYDTRSGFTCSIDLLQVVSYESTTSICIRHCVSTLDK